MPSSQRPLIALVAVALLAGCSDAPPAGDARPSATVDGSSSAAPIPRPPVADLELAKKTIQFAAAMGGPASEADARVPETHGNVTITYRVLSDCPAGYAKSPSLVAEDAEGAVTTLWAYPVVAPGVSEPYTCPVNGGFSDRERATGSVTLAAVPGTLTVATVGEFSADVEVAIVASA